MFLPYRDRERDSGIRYASISTAPDPASLSAARRRDERIRLSVEKMIKARGDSTLRSRTPDTNAQLLAENIAQQIEKRISHRRAMKNACRNAHGRKGIKVMCLGCPGGREIAGR